MVSSSLIPLIVAASLAGQPPVASGAHGGSASRPAGAPRVVVAAVEVALPGGPQVAREGVQAALERGLAAGGLEVIPHLEANAALTRHPELRGCASPTCRARLGRLLHAPLCATVVLRGGPRQLEITVSILDCATGVPRSVVTRSCRAGTPEQAAQAVARLAEEASPQAARASPRPDARRAPGSRDPAAGARRRRPPALRSLWSGLSLAGAGLVATVTGATLWGLDGRLYERRPTLDRVYRTRTGGITTVSLGMAAILGGVTMAVLAFRRAPSSAQAVAGSARPASYSVVLDPTRCYLGLSGSF